jgi:copper chaperone CopZ
MKQRFSLLLLTLLTPFPAMSPAAKKPGAEPPHTPTLVFYLTGIANESEAETLRASVQKLPSVSKIEVNLPRGQVQVRFDSHIISYHQVAQAITDAGASLGKQWDPRLKIIVPDYAKDANATKVDALFAGKRLNQRTKIEPLDKAKGIFFVHFLPLKIDPAETGPQGFNGGHLHHPISDPPPRGLGLECFYEAAGSDP